MDLLKMTHDAALAAARGAAAGSVVPGVGTALGAAGGAVLSLAPELGRWLFGPGAGDTIDAVRAAVVTATGTADPDGQVAALADPAVAGKLRLDLAQIAAERDTAREVATQNRLDALLQDVADARRQTVALAASGSLLSWGAPTVSVIVLLAFGTLSCVVLFHQVPEGSQSLANVLLGSLASMAGAVVQFWVGSSAGSARKDKVIANSVPVSLLPRSAALLLPPPAALVPAADVPR